MDRTLHAVVVMRAEMTRYHDSRAACQPREEADEYIYDRSDASDRGIIARDAGLTDDPCIDHVVELLKQVSYQQRNGKGQQVFCNAALCHVKLGLFSEPPFLYAFCRHCDPLLCDAGCPAHGAAATGLFKYTTLRAKMQAEQRRYCAGAVIFPPFQAHGQRRA